MSTGNTMGTMAAKDEEQLGTPLTPIHKWSTFFTPHLFCRDNIIQPMEVDSEGKLVPMSGLRENSLTEEGKSESGVDGETEEGEKD